MQLLRVKLMAQLAALVSTIAMATGAEAQSKQVVIESWRADDLAAWNDVIIPAFKKTHPNIDVVYRPTQSSLYNSALNAKLEGGTAGDVVACRGFDASLGLYRRGQLAKLNDLPGIENFDARGKTAWTTDDGADTFCVPIASVILGYIYNKEVFQELSLTPPKSSAEFTALLDKIKASGRYTPLAFGLGDPWVGALFGFHNNAPNYYHGEDGRRALIEGKAKLTDAPFVAALGALAKLQPYLAAGFESQKNTDSKQLFALGRAAIYPGGSWDIGQLAKTADFPMGAFPPPPANSADGCYVSENPDIGMGLNAKSANREAARAFLSWVASPDFAKLYVDALPGYFSLQKGPVPVKNELAAEFGSWRERCKPSIWLSYQLLSRGQPNLESEIFRVSGEVIRKKMTPEAAASELQSGLDRWYKPAAK